MMLYFFIDFIITYPQPLVKRKIEPTAQKRRGLSKITDYSIVQTLPDAGSWPSPRTRLSCP